ncbi:TetR/AcrR family transcriptional regulator [Candidatus Saccharibacteria bacterium]|nr:TetR/AcrR family transcriptional regulator [Candidatus Saccharibacteria bacterium]
MQITRQKLKNKHFRKTEEAILRVFFEGNGSLTIEQIAKKVGVARSTVYYHHRRVNEIVQDYEKYILGEYCAIVRRLEGMKINKVFNRMLLFIMVNREVFSILLMGSDRDVLIKMMDEIKPLVIEFAKMHDDFEMVFEIYTNEIIVVVKRWGEMGFLEDKMASVLGDIMYLTQTLKVRLGPLVRA